MGSRSYQVGKALLWQHMQWCRHSTGILCKETRLEYTDLFDPFDEKGNVSILTYLYVNKQLTAMETGLVVTTPGLSSSLSLSEWRLCWYRALMKWDHHSWFSGMISGCSNHSLFTEDVQRAIVCPNVLLDYITFACLIYDYMFYALSFWHLCCWSEVIVQKYFKTPVFKVPAHAQV